MTRQRGWPSINTKVFCRVDRIWLFIAFGLLLSARTVASAYFSQGQITVLEVGKPLLREMTGAESHTYQVLLATGQYLHLVVDQRGIDLELGFFGPDGQKLIEMDCPNNTQGPEAVSLIAQQPGSYRVEIKSLVGGAPKGQYEVKVKVIRAATEQDRKWIAAQGAYADGQQLRRQRTAESRRASIEKYQEAILLWHEVGDRLMEAHALLCAGTSWRGLGQPQQALECYRQALELQQMLEGRQEVANTHFLIGIAYNELGEPRKSLEFFNQALSRQRTLADSVAQAQTLANIGQAYLSLGEARKALEYYNQVLPVWQKMNNRPQEVTTLHNLGTVYEALDEYQNALEHYLQALALQRSLQDRGGEAGELNSIGFVNSLLGEWKKSLEYYGQALSLWRVTGDRRREAIVLSNLGRAYAAINEPGKALEHYTLALQLHRAAGNRLSEAVTLEQVGRLHAASGDFRKALEVYEQSLALRRSTGDRVGEASTLSFIGGAYTSLGDSRKAVTYLTQSLALFREAEARRGEAAVLNSLMLLWKDRDRPRLAILFGKQSINIYQGIRSNIRALDRESQQSFLKSKERSYRTLADLLIADGRLPEAEQVIRMLKEDEYFDFIRRDQPNAPEASKARMTKEEEVLENRYREIADQLTALGAERGTLLEKQTRTPAEEQHLAKLDADLTVAGQAFQKFLDGLASELGKQADANARVFQLREAQGLMGDLRELGKGVVALYTLVGEDKYRVILTTADVQKAYESPIKAADLNRKVLDFRAALQNPKLDPLPLAQELYNILVAPVAKDLKAAQAETLMWSLDGVLRYIPIAALHDGQQYLIERFRNVVFTPASQARLKDVPSRNWRVLGLGVTKAHGERIPALPGVLDEMRGIIKEEGSTSGVLPGTIKLDEQFTQEAMLAGLRQRPPVVHVASHFQFQPGNETNSALLLGDGSFLSLAQIKSLPNVFAGVDLLTLSACNTATGGSGANGKEVEGFGVLAQRQGAKAVIASLWPVADRSTKVLMQEFYRLREASAGTTKAEALRQAQLKLLRGEMAVTADTLAADTLASRQIAHEEDKSGNRPRFTPDPKKPYAHPYYWAPFILIGNWK